MAGAKLERTRWPGIYRRGDKYAYEWTDAAGRRRRASAATREEASTRKADEEAKAKRGDLPESGGRSRATVAGYAFELFGADLDRELPIPLREALLGGDVPVDTPKGRVLLTIPPGTQSGRTFRLTGRGLPRFKADGFGDVFVRVRVVLPTDLSDEARAAAERFLDLADRSDPRTRET